MTDRIGERHEVEEKINHRITVCPFAVSFSRCIRGIMTRDVYQVNRIEVDLASNDTQLALVNIA